MKFTTIGLLHARFDQDGIFDRGEADVLRSADFVTPLVFAAYTLLLPLWEYCLLLYLKKHNCPLYGQWSMSMTLGCSLAYAIFQLWRLWDLPEHVGESLCARVLGSGGCAELKGIVACNALVLVDVVIAIGLWSHLHRQDRALWQSGGLQSHFAMPQAHHYHPEDVEEPHWQQQQEQQHGGHQPDLTAPLPPAYHTQPLAQEAGKQGS